MDRPEHVSLCVIIADNDPDGSAAAVVSGFRSAADFSVYYQVERRRGIPYARNNVFAQASELGITELAFVDDDEYVDRAWCTALWDYYVHSDADVVTGYVQTVYPPETPAWVVDGGFYVYSRDTTGKQLQSAATNNVLFDFQKIVGEWNTMFDERFGLTGGSDAQFFSEAVQRGAVIRWVQEAVVYEELERERMRPGYILKRRFRKSNIKPQYKDLPRAQKYALLRDLLKKIICRLPMVPWAFAKGFSQGLHVLYELTALMANLCALLGIRIRWDEYALKGTGKHEGDTTI